MRVYVDKLPEKVTEPELMEAFGFFGTVKDVELLPVKEPKAERSAWVEMENEQEARKAKEALNGEEFLGYPIEVRVDVTPVD